MRFHKILYQTDAENTVLFLKKYDLSRSPKLAKVVPTDGILSRFSATVLRKEGSKQKDRKHAIRVGLLS